MKLVIMPPCHGGVHGFDPRTYRKRNYGFLVIVASTLDLHSKSTSSILVGSTSSLEYSSVVGEMVDTGGSGKFELRSVVKRYPWLSVKPYNLSEVRTCSFESSTIE